MDDRTWKRLYREEADAQTACVLQLEAALELAKAEDAKCGRRHKAKKARQRARGK